jgi:hypothetical protein
MFPLESAALAWIEFCPEPPKEAMLSPPNTPPGSEDAERGAANPQGMRRKLKAGKTIAVNKKRRMVI